MSNESQLLEILNKMVEVLDPIKFEDLNVTWTAINQEDLIALEKKHNEIGIKKENDKYCASVASLITTITALLIGRRLAFKIDDNGYIIGFQWFKE